MEKTLNFKISAIEYLFNPQTDPFKPHFRGVSLVDEIITTIEDMPLDEILKIELEVEGNADHIEKQSVYAAVKQYCRHQMKNEQANLLRIKREGTASLLRGFVFLAICFILSALVKQLELDHKLLGYLFSEGIVIAGWVALWEPFEMLLLNRQPHRRKLKALSKLGNAKWQITT